MELKSKITENRSSLEEFNNRFDWAVERISEYEREPLKLLRLKSEMKKEDEKRPQPKGCMGGHKAAQKYALWESQKGKRVKGTEIIFEKIMAETFQI